MSEYAILGGGLAGLSLSYALLDRGVPSDHITVVDALTDGRGSGAPGALLHPFPGRSVAPKHPGFEVFGAARDFIEWADATISPTTPLLNRVPMVRPLQDDELSGGLRESYDAHAADYPDWLHAEIGAGARYSRLAPGLERFDDVLIYEPAYVCDLDELCRRFVESLEQRGVRWVDGRATGLESAGADGPKDSKGWRIRGPAPTVTARRVVLTMGFGLDDWFPDLATRGRGGELLVAAAPPDASLECIVNASGHVAPRVDGAWVAGSTWWSPDDARRPGADGPKEERKEWEQARRALLERCAPLVPPLRTADVERIWSGVRCSFGDHQPLVGPVSGIDGLFVLGALGSKGLFRAPYFAGRLADHLVESADLPRLADARRISARKWRPDVRHIDPR